MAKNSKRVIIKDRKDLVEIVQQNYGNLFDYELVKNKIDNLDIQELYNLMDFVKEKHTYINRIKTLMDFLL